MASTYFDPKLKNLKRKRSLNCNITKDKSKNTFIEYESTNVNECEIYVLDFWKKYEKKFSLLKSSHYEDSLC
jgi:hypothetical protein